MASINVGILGYGFATKVFHAPLVASTPGLTLAGISSSDPAKVAADWPEIKTYPTPESMFVDPSIDLVVIPTPNETHFSLAASALAAGKHVVVDKPFTISGDQARELIVRARSANRLLSVFHNRRWDGDLLAVKQVLADGVLGRIVHFESHFDRFRPDVRKRWREDAVPGSGLWYDLGSHLLDQALHLFGEPDRLWLDTAIQRDGSVTDDWFHAVLGYGAKRVVLHASALVLNPGPRFSIHGTRGHFACFGLDPQEDALRAGLKPGDADWPKASDPGTLTTIADEATETRAVDVPCGDYVAYYAGVARAIREGAHNPVPPEEVVRVIALIEKGLAQVAARR